MSIVLPPVRRSSEIRTHAMDRALERYGLVLTFHDICDMQHRCGQGEGLTQTNADGSEYHTLIQADRVLYLVYKPPGLSGRPHGVILTIMPNSVAMSRVKHDVKFMARRKGQRKAWR